MNKQVQQIKAEIERNLEKMSYHAAMELINNPKFLPTTTFSELIPMLQKLYKDGANWKEKQMLKNAVEVSIAKLNADLTIDVTYDEEDRYLRKLECKEGDKVKLIIIKEE